jgi:hypothetical protein
MYVIGFHPRAFFWAIYHQKATQNAHMGFDMKEIKNKIKGDRLKQPPCKHLVCQNVDLQSLSIIGKSCSIASIHCHLHL